MPIRMLRTRAGSISPLTGRSETGSIASRPNLGTSRFPCRRLLGDAAVVQERFESRVAANDVVDQKPEKLLVADPGPRRIAFGITDKIERSRLLQERCMILLVFGDIRERHLP